MAERLTAHAPVLYVDPPISHLTRFNNPAVAASARAARICGSVAPRHRALHAGRGPEADPPGDDRRLTARIVRRQLARAVRRLGGDVHAVISTWLFVDAYGVCGEQRRVYWWQDDPVGAAAHWGADADRLGRAEERLAPRLGPDRRRQRGRGRALAGARACRPRTCPTAATRRSSPASTTPTRRPTSISPGPIAGFVGHHQQPHRPRAARGGRGRGHLAAADRPQGPGVRARALRRGSSSARQRRLRRRRGRSSSCRRTSSAIDVGLVPYGADRVQPLELPDEDARVPGRRAPGRRRRRCPPCAGSTPTW